MAKKTVQAEIQEIGMDILHLSIKLAEKVKEQNSLINGIVDDGGHFNDHLERMGLRSGCR